MHTVISIKDGDLNSKKQGKSDQNMTKFLHFAIKKIIWKCPTSVTLILRWLYFRGHCKVKFDCIIIIRMDIVAVYCFMFICLSQPHKPGLFARETSPG